MLFVSMFMCMTRLIVSTYTYTTLPLYYLIQKPWKKIAKARECGGKQVDPTDPSSEWERQFDTLYHPLFQCKSIGECLTKMVDYYPPNKPTLGYRQMLSEEVQLDSEGNHIRINGKVLRKYTLSDYKWLTAGQTHERIDNIAQGLDTIGITVGDRVAIYAETCVEWFLTNNALIKMGAVVVTVFNTLSDEGIIHAITETEVNYIITSFDLITKMSDLSKHMPLIKTVVYFEGPQKKVEYNFDQTIRVLTFTELEIMGRRVGSQIIYNTSMPEDVCMIMYTSGTSGRPKGVLITQGQLMAGMKSMAYGVTEFITNGPNLTYIAYLPSAHIFELTAHLSIYVCGFRVGFATPFTLSESSPGLAVGTASDLSLLKPTVMIAVPLILDRIRKELYAKLKARSPVFTHLFDYLIQYKSYWIRKGYSTPIINRFICSQIRQQFGGKIKYMCVGGAHLSPQLHELIKCAANVQLINGYGCTETTSGVIGSDENDLSYGRVGAPMKGAKIKLEDWEEGGYSNEDSPHPRGEIVVGGKMVSIGYFKLDELNRQSFYRDSNGVQWFKTGDIGEVFTDGTFKIIDRKIDLIKLINGEFISLGKIETALKSNPFVDNVCVVTHPMTNNLVAIIQPNIKALTRLCKRMEINDSTPFPQICVDPVIVEHIQQSIKQTAVQQKLHRKEIPTIISICDEEWSPDNGCLTAALKLKRKAILDRHRELIEDMFRSIE